MLPRFRSLCSLTSLSLFAGTLAVAVTASAQMPGKPLFIAGSGPDELWEITTRFEMVGMPMQMPAQTSQMCIKKDRAQRPESHIPRDDKCKTTKFTTRGNTVSYEMECTGDEPMTGSGEITSTPTSYEGKMRMQTRRRGESVDMRQNFQGRKIGACTDQSEKVFAESKAESDAMRAKGCADGLERLQGSFFYGDRPLCGAQQQQFTDRVNAMTRDASLYRATRRKLGGAIVSEAFRSAQIDQVPARRNACSAAVRERDWSFVGSGECDDDVRAQAPQNCGSRSRSPEPVFFPLCSRYVTLTRGGNKGDDSTAAPPATATQQRTPAPAAPAQTRPEDAVKQGIDAVRKLLPF